MLAWKLALALKVFIILIQGYAILLIFYLLCAFIKLNENIHVIVFI